MVRYVECTECQFVLLSRGGSEPQPLRWDSCPGCRSTEFRYVSE